MYKVFTFGAKITGGGDLYGVLLGIGIFYVTLPV